MEAGRRTGGPNAVRNTLPGSVTGPVVQAGAVHELHLNTRWKPVVPAQLPPPPSALPGRDRELAELDRCRATPGRLPLAVLSGPGGIGKTALALRWLHRIRTDCSDGQLYVDLAASDPAGPVPPDKVLQWFLHALGVPPEDIPDEQPEREAIFRSLTADRALALLLDNAASAAQVRPLLPATVTGVVVVTSRWRLNGLAMHGARFVEVGPLGPAESTAVLAEVIGPERVAAEPNAAERLVSVCGGVPLALTLVAARLRTRPRRPLTREATALAERADLLRLSTEDDPALRAAFDSSYESLPPAAARLYRLCGLYPGGRVRADVLAAVTGEALGDVEEGLDELVDANLLAEGPDDHLRCHDLLRAHAREVARRDCPEPERAAAARALVEWHLDMLVRADIVLHPHRWRVGPRYARLAAEAPAFPDARAALRWLEHEQQAMWAALREAAAWGWSDLVWQFCEALWGFFTHHQHYTEWIQVHEEFGVPAAQRRGHRLAEVRLRGQLAFALAKVHRYPDAARENEKALRLAKAEGHEPSIASALSQLGRVARGLGDLTTAIEHYRAAARLQDRLGIPRGVALCRRRIGEVLVELGRVDEAVVELEAAARIMVEVGDPVQHARALVRLGTLHGRQGRAEEARRLLHTALATVRDLGSPHHTAEVLAALGELAADGGDPVTARDALTEAVALYAAAENPRAGALAARLRELP
ncbi:Tetratricopeptide repeat-containing protein [Amycolatopsis arida]|uniref:Tetratricopeptide repeat-containing protein n=1 Tax=Amycolatopsis arida TaxID=587909 RepID=A0A1I5YI09_9PSEU|nr:tetratricopeptide repeat protein [Amycolatopsis arida]TDX90529.1 tetratricopeptide repeat protein [Amycolatopsis arida]SFQ43829.1 Tetratricopeptide repeat-containing protein [Amycolatopsis arida]